MKRQSPHDFVSSHESVADKESVSATDTPLWLQAQAAQRIGTRHGEARTPADLRKSFALATWPGSPELRLIYTYSADKSITAVARHLARQEITDTCDRIGGIHTDPATKELTPASADLLEQEYIHSQREHIYAIDCGSDPRL